MRYTNNRRRNKAKKKQVNYRSMERVRKARYRLSKSERAVFDVEVEPERINHSIEDKAKLSGLIVKQYKEALDKIHRNPTVELMIEIGVFENDFLSNCYKKLAQALEWAKAKKDYKAVLQSRKKRS